MKQQILKHLKKAHSAGQKGDLKGVRFHIGHALSATNKAIANPGMMNDNADPDSGESDNNGDDTMAGNHWIQGAITHPGALHKELGVPQGETIPAKKIDAAADSSNPTLARRANLAKTLKKMHKK